MGIGPLRVHLYKTFPEHLENVYWQKASSTFSKCDLFSRKGLVKVMLKMTFTKLNGPISNTFELLKVSFHTVNSEFHSTQFSGKGMTTRSSPPVYCFWGYIGGIMVITHLATGSNYESERNKE